MQNKGKYTNYSEEQENNSPSLSLPSISFYYKQQDLKKKKTLRIAVRRQVVSVLTTEINFLNSGFTCCLWHYNSGSWTGRQDPWMLLMYCTPICTDTGGHAYTHKYTRSLALMPVPVYCSTCLVLRYESCLLLMKSFLAGNERHHTKATKET